VVAPAFVIDRCQRRLRTSYSVFPPSVVIVLQATEFRVEAHRATDNRDDHGVGRGL
jgi:hypothetical protein